MLIGDAWLPARLQAEFLLRRRSNVVIRVIVEFSLALGRAEVILALVVVRKVPVSVTLHVHTADEILFHRVADAEAVVSFQHT